jgi:hypothetical protein
MKRLVILAACLFALSGCMMPLGPCGPDPVDPCPDCEDCLTRLVEERTPVGTIYAPQANSQPLLYNANFDPGALIILEFAPGTDQYGNPTGVSDSRYIIDTVTIQCSSKPEPDTVFLWKHQSWPQQRVWFPTWTAPIEPISGLPMPYLPLPKYPWSYCRKAISGTPTQTATIHATAKATWITVEFLLPDQGGYYSFEGETPTESSSIVRNVGRSGFFKITHSGGTIYECEVMESWFWIEGSWTVDVGPSASC